MKDLLKTECKYEDISEQYSYSERQLHAVLGAMSELGEIADIWKKHLYHDKSLDIDHLREEIGDVLWYLAILLDEYGWTFEQVLQETKDKLSRRYGE